MLRPVAAAKEAILIMDSRSAQKGLRGSGLSASWSKLYKAGGVYLDLSLKLEGSGAVLLGQVITESKQPKVRTLTLLDSGGAPVASSPVSDYGGFRLELKDQGDYALEFSLGGETFKVEGLEVF